MASRAAVLSLVSALAVAVPFDALHGLKQFSVHQVAAPRSNKAYGPVAVMHDHAKYNAAVPEHVKAAAAAAANSGSVAANPEVYDQEYLEAVTVGSQTLNLDFDTGSSDLWVYSNQQPSSQTTGHDIYKPAGAAAAGQSWKIGYGDGSGASGKVYYDKVVIGGVTATSQAVEAATSVSAQFQSDTNNDGLVGLAFPDINTCSPNICKTFMQNVGSSLAANLFTSSLKKGKAGSYDFGYIDSKKYTGAISYAPISTSQGFWEFTAGGYSVGSTAYGTSLDTIMDTGTSLVYLPDSVLTNYYKQVSGSSNSATYGGWVFPCSATLPSLGIKIGGVTKTVPGSYINYAPVNSGKTTCFGGVQSSSSLGINILGDVFIKSQFVVYDVGNSRIGVATPSSL